MLIRKGSAVADAVTCNSGLAKDMENCVRNSGGVNHDRNVASAPVAGSQHEGVIRK